MDRETLVRHLDSIEKLLAASEKLIAEQKDFVAELARQRRDIGDAIDMLAIFESHLWVHKANRDWLVSKLADSSIAEIRSEKKKGAG